MHYEFHPAANEFPLMDEKRLSDLAEDIHANGQRESIRLFREKILDGRNRYRACIIAGATPRYDKLPDDLDPWAYVWSLNGARRDLTADQRYLIWKSCSEQSEAWKAEQTRIQDEANRKRSEATKAQPRTEDGTRLSTGQVVPQVEALPASPKVHVTSEAKAAASKTYRGAVERMDYLSRKRPDLADKVKLGDLPAAAALREMKRDAMPTAGPLPKDKHTVIYADPPWSYNDKCDAGSVQSKGAEHHYPSMSLSELKLLDIKSLSAENSVLFLWATSPLLPDALELSKAWGFTYKASFVWDKILHNMGHYNSVRHEFLLVCTRGSCTPQNVKLFDSVQSIERTKHSEKPEIFREIIDTLYPNGHRIELFRRGSIPNGWKAWGNETI